MKYRIALISAMALGCGGSRDAVTPPPPPPVATSIEVSPASRSMLVGDTLTLVAVVRDQNGATMTGVAVTWASSNANVATVSNSGKVTAVAVGSATISASASGKHGDASLTIAVPTPVATLEPSNRKSATIGPEGGSITATSSAGLQYVLVIPAGALMSAQQISMTPITDIAHLGLSGGLAGAVDLQPSGLQFAMPARLRIKSSRTAPSGTRLAGFTANSDFSKRSLSRSVRVASEIEVLVSHFSSAGAAFGTTTEIDANFVDPSDPSFDGLLSRVNALEDGTAWDLSEITLATSLAQQMFTQFVHPGLINALTDADLVKAYYQTIMWRLVVALIASGGVGSNASIGIIADLPVPNSFASDVQTANSVLAVDLRLAVSGNSRVCGDQASVAALRNVLFWYGGAQSFRLDNAQSVVSTAFVLNEVRTKCAVVVLKNTNLPDSLPGGQNFNLDLNFALRFRNGVEQPSDFRVDLAGSGVNVTNPGGFTGIGDALSPVGYYTTVIKPASDLGFRLKSKTCFVAVRSVPDPSMLCDEIELTKVVYLNDFEASAGIEWTLPAIATSPNGKKFLGVMQNTAVLLTVDSIPPHSKLVLDFDLYIIGSWNGNAEVAGSGSPDVIEWSALGGQAFKKTTFSNKPRDNQAYPGDFPGGSFAFASGSFARSALGFPPGSDFIGDAIYRLRFTIDHTATSVTLKFASDHFTDSSEKWGLDNVRVKYVP